MSLVPCRECGREVTPKPGPVPIGGVPKPSGQQMEEGRCLGCGGQIQVLLGGACPLCGLANPLERLIKVESSHCAQCRKKITWNESKKKVGDLVYHTGCAPSSGAGGQRADEIRKKQGGVLGIFLMIIGFGWAALGAANILMMFGNGASEGVAMFGFIFNMVLFVLPGLVLGGIGKRLHG